MKITELTNFRTESIPLPGGYADIRIADDVTNEPLFGLASVANALQLTRTSLLTRRVPEHLPVAAVIPGQTTPTLYIDGRSLRTALRASREPHRVRALLILQWLYTCYPEPDDPKPDYGTHVAADIRQRYMAQTLPGLDFSLSAALLMQLLQQGEIAGHNDRIWLPFRLTESGTLQMTLPGPLAPPEMPETPFYASSAQVPARDL